MFDRTLDPIRDSLPPVVQAKILNYITDLDLRRETLTDRHATDVGVETEGVALLRQILNFARPDDVRTRHVSDVDRLMIGIRPILSDMERIFDPAYTGFSKRHLFTHGRTTQDILVPVRGPTMLTAWPLEASWDQWAEMRPLRLLDFDSQELTFNTYQDLIVFKRDMPSRLIIGLDVALLCLQYIKYLDHHEGDPRLLQVSYIHRYVLNRSLLQDLQDLWLRNRYLDVLETGVTMARDTFREAITNNIYGYLGLQYDEAMRSVLALSRRVSKGAMHPSLLLSSLPLSKGHIPDLFREFETSYVTEDTRQTYWIRFLKDRTWLRLVHAALHLNPKFVAYTNFRRHLSRELSLLVRRRIENMIKDPVLRQDVMVDIARMQSWLE